MSPAMTVNSNIEVFDKHLVRHNRCRSAVRLNDHRFIFEWSMKEISSRLDLIKRDFQSVLQVGARAPRYSDTVTLIDMTPDLGVDIIADEEFLPISWASQDLVLSPLSLHSVNDLPGALVQVSKTLKPDGLFMGALFGGETLYQLRESMQQAELNLYGGMSPRVSPFADMQQMGALMQRAGFALPVVDSEKIQVGYNSLQKLLHDLRYMGEGCALVNRSKKVMSKKYWDAVENYYKQHFSDENDRLNATFEVIFVSGWSPHDSQQQALRPGSADNRLSDVLNTEEEVLPC